MDSLAYSFSESIAGLELSSLLDILAGVGLASIRIGSFFLASPLFGSAVTSPPVGGAFITTVNDEEELKRVRELHASAMKRGRRRFHSMSVHSLIDSFVVGQEKLTIVLYVIYRLQGCAFIPNMIISCV